MTTLYFVKYLYLLYYYYNYLKYKYLCFNTAWTWISELNDLVCCCCCCCLFYSLYKWHSGAIWGICNILKYFPYTCSDSSMTNLWQELGLTLSCAHFATSNVIQRLTLPGLSVPSFLSICIIVTSVGLKKTLLHLKKLRLWFERDWAWFKDSMQHYSFKVTKPQRIVLLLLLLLFLSALQNDWSFFSGHKKQQGWIQI